jgi:hypothetical protein
MPIVTISRIQHRKGLQDQLPQLAGAELGWAMDKRRLFIGNGLITDGAPELGNTEILTEYSEVLQLANQYTFKNSDAGYNPVTGDHSSQYNAAILHNGLYIAVGTNGSIISSTDTITWNNVISGVKHSLNSIAYGVGIYVVVGAAGTILTSASGSQWSQANFSNFNSLNSVIYQDNTFWAVSDSGEIIVSNNGTTWAYKNSPVVTGLNSICYGNGVYVAVGNAGVVLRSTDGTTWTNATISKYNLYAVNYQLGQFVATGQHGKTYTSTNGITWNRVLTDAFVATATDAQNASFFLTSWGDFYRFNNGTYQLINNVGYDQTFSNMYYAQSQFVAITETGKIYTGGVNGWTSQTSGVSTALYGVFYDNVSSSHKWIVVGAAGVILTSTDAITWTAQTSGVTDKLYDVTIYSTTTYIAVGENGQILTSPNAVTWTSHATGSNDLYSVAVANPSTGVYTAVAAGNNGAVLSSSNTSTWNIQTISVYDTNGDAVNVSRINRIAWYSWTNIQTQVVKNYVAVGDDGLLMTSTNLTTWTAQATNTTGHILGITNNNNTFFFCAESGLAAGHSVDQLTWTTDSQNYGSNAVIPDNLAVMYNGTYNVIAGQFGTIFASTGQKYFRTITNLNYDIHALLYNGGVLNLAFGSSGLVATTANISSWNVSSYNYGGTVTYRSIQKKLDDFVSVKDFGAVGDGLTDDTLAINLALKQLYCVTANPAARKTLYFPAGHYIVTNSINVPSNARLVGEGSSNTIVEQARPPYLIPVVTWVMYTADKLQQTQGQIGLNGADLPHDISISHMTLKSVSDGIWIDKATRVSLDNVNFTGNKSRVNLLNDAVLNYPACGVNLRGGALTPPTDISISNCKFQGFNAGIFADDGMYISTVVVHSCSFQDMYQGLHLTSSTGDTKQMTVSHCVFDQIYNHGIEVNNATNFVSTFNWYREVGNALHGSPFPESEVIYFGSACAGCASIGDEFERTNAQNLTVKRVTATTGSVDWQYNTLLRMGTYAQTQGRSVVLTDNTTAAVIGSGFDVSFAKPISVEMIYTLTRDTSIRTGTFRVIIAGGGLSNYDDDYYQLGTTDVHFDFNGTDITYTTTSTGHDGLLNYAFRFMEML